MAVPTVPELQSYLGGGTSAAPADIESALNAEKAAQAQWCEVPADDADWPADLIEALCRRVARNLYLRGLPSGLVTVSGELGGSYARLGEDTEIKRLEEPYSNVAIG